MLWVSTGPAGTGELSRAGDASSWVSPNGGCTPEAGRQNVSLFNDMGLFSLFCSFSKRLIFNFASCRNLSTPCFPGFWGLAAWATSLRLWLSICRASKWASLYTSTNFSPVRGLQVRGLPEAAARACSETWLPRRKLAAMHLSLCPTAPKKTSSSSFALHLKKRINSDELHQHSD